MSTSDARTAIVPTKNHPSEASARTALAECDTGLPYLGTWNHPDLAGPVHMFTSTWTPDELQANNWTREDA